MIAQTNIYYYRADKNYLVSIRDNTICHFVCATGQCSPNISHRGLCPPFPFIRVRQQRPGQRVRVRCRFGSLVRSQRVDGDAEGRDLGDEDSREIEEGHPLALGGEAPARTEESRISQNRRLFKNVAEAAARSSEPRQRQSLQVGT